MSQVPMFRRTFPKQGEVVVQETPDTLAKLSGEDVHLCIFDSTQMVFVSRRNQVARPHNTVITMEASPCHSTGVSRARLG